MRKTNSMGGRRSIYHIILLSNAVDSFSHRLPMFTSFGKGQLESISSIKGELKLIVLGRGYENGLIERVYYLLKEYRYSILIDNI